MTTEGCSTEICPSEREVAPWRTAFIVVVVVIIILAWIVFSWRPVFPVIDALIARVLASVAGLLGAYLLLDDTQGDRGDIGESCASVKETCSSGLKICYSSLGWLGKKLLQVFSLPILF